MLFKIIELKKDHNYHKIKWNSKQYEKLLGNWVFNFIEIIYDRWSLCDDWIINYKGGYIRRGLLGEISINLSNFLDLNIKYVFLLIHLSTYLLFHLIFYLFFSNFKKN